MPSELPIQFISTDKRVSGERRSKLLKHETPLYNWVENARANLHKAGYVFDTRDPHIEVLKEEERDMVELSVARARELQGRLIALSPLIKLGNALVLGTGQVEGYGDTHITIAYFRQGLTG